MTKHTGKAYVVATINKDGKADFITPKHPAGPVLFVLSADAEEWRKELQPHMRHKLKVLRCTYTISVEQLSRSKPKQKNRK